MKHNLRFACLLLTACLLFGGCALQKKELPMAEAFDFRMDTWIRQQWYGENAQKTCDEIDAAIQELEYSVSLYLETSEISQINTAAGKGFLPVSEPVYALLKESVKVCEESGGVFDITVAPLSLLWDVTASAPQIPLGQEITAAQAKVDYRKLLFDDATRSVMLLEEGMRLDLGGAAKGLAAGRMREIAEKNNVSGFLSVGGNMLVVGKKPDNSDFVIGLRDPRGEENQYFATVTLEGLTMATTGDYERYFEKDGVRYHHVLDPFTGYPSTKDLIAVTVIAEDGLLADCLSTAIFLQGSGCLAQYFARADCMVLAVTDTFDVYASPAFWERLTPVKGTTYTLHND